MNEAPDKPRDGFKVVDIGLDDCPFCHEDPEFGIDFKTGHFELRHYPSKGVICPARGLHFCPDEAFARRLWNWRPDPLPDPRIDLDGYLRRMKEFTKDIASSPERARAFLV